jgi:hypothetical protein
MTKNNKPRTVEDKRLGRADPVEDLQTPAAGSAPESCQVTDSGYKLRAAIPKAWS